MSKYEIKVWGDTISIYLEGKMILSKWKGKRWHRIEDSGAWGPQIDARYIPRKVYKDVILAEKLSGWRK